MGFLKVDDRLLDSSTWSDPVLWRVMETACLLCKPEVFEDPTPTIDVETAQPTGWLIPPGTYGFAPVAGIGIINRAFLDPAVGYAALRTLAAPEPISRSQQFEGRRVVRIDGGFVILNYMAYRDRDYRAVERNRRWRERQKAAREAEPETETPPAPPLELVGEVAPEPASNGGKKKPRARKPAEDTVPLAVLENITAAWADHIGVPPAPARFTQLVHPLLVTFGEARVLKAIDAFAKERHQQQDKGRVYTGDPLTHFAHSFKLYDPDVTAEEAGLLPAGF